MTYLKKTDPELSKGFRGEKSLMLRKFVGLLSKKTESSKEDFFIFLLVYTK